MCNFSLILLGISVQVGAGQQAISRLFYSSFLAASGLLQVAVLDSKNTTKIGMLLC